jgi:hypothetical protein
MKNLIPTRIEAALALAAFVAIAGIALLTSPATTAQAASGKAYSTTKHDSLDITVTTASVRIQTPMMASDQCTGWRFRNTGAGTARLNINNNTTAALAATFDGQLNVPAGEIVELTDHLIVQFRVISDAGTSLEVDMLCND